MSQNLIGKYWKDIRKYVYFQTDRKASEKDKFLEARKEAKKNQDI